MECAAVHDLVWHAASVTRGRREVQNAHPAVVLWFTGLSGAGKSTLAHAVEVALHERDRRTFVMDGDNIRHGICRDLGFSDADRTENIRRVSEVAKLFVDAGVVALGAFISPLRAQRELARSIVGVSDFIEIYCRCELTICEQRDVKGFYRKARLGDIQCFTGISSVYEEPLSPDLELNTGRLSLAACVDEVISLLRGRGIV